MIHKAQRRLLVQAAAKQLLSLPPSDRADLLEAIALLLSKVDGRELARHTAALLRQAEEHQRKLLQLLANLV